jgi:hypothetical protein
MPFEKIIENFSIFGFSKFGMQRHQNKLVIDMQHKLNSTWNFQWLCILGYFCLYCTHRYNTRRNFCKHVPQVHELVLRAVVLLTEPFRFVELSTPLDTGSVQVKGYYCLLMGVLCYLEHLIEKLCILSLLSAYFKFKFLITNTFINCIGDPWDDYIFMNYEYIPGISGAPVFIEDKD